MTWTCTIVNQTTDSLTEPGIVLTSGTLSTVLGTTLAPQATATFQCEPSFIKGGIVGPIAWMGATGSAQLNWSVPLVGTYSTSCTGAYTASYISTDDSVTFTISGGTPGTEHSAIAYERWRLGGDPTPRHCRARGTRGGSCLIHAQAPPGGCALDPGNADDSRGPRGSLVGAVSGGGGALGLGGPEDAAAPGGNPGIAGRSGPAGSSSAVSHF